MKILVMASVFLLSTAAFSAEKTFTIVQTNNLVSTTNSTLAPNMLAFNFVGMAQGKANVYFDVGGMSERVSPSLSFRTFSNKEPRKQLEDAKLTVDRTLATVGVSVAALKSENRSLIVNPYLFFGTEKDSVNTDAKNGIGVRLLGQVAVNKSMSVQAGFDGNNIEETFKSDVYVGLGFNL